MRPPASRTVMATVALIVSASVSAVTPRRAVTAKTHIE
jgi:hypothetical protein